MNSIFHDKIFIQTVRYQLRRYVLLQQNINKISIARHINNFHYKNENSVPCHYSGFCRKIFCRKQPLLCMNFQRNMSSEVRIANNSLQSSTTHSPLIKDTEEVDMLPILIEAISQNPLVKWSEEFLIEFHEATQLPWCASLAVSAFLIRILVLLPLSVYQRIILGKLEVISEQSKNIEKSVEKRVKNLYGQYGWSDKLLKNKVSEEMSKVWSTAVEKEKCQPFTVWYLLILQPVTWFTMTLATRNLCVTALHPDGNTQETYTEMVTEGVGWFTDLTTVDPYMILPVMWVLLNLAIIQVHQSLRTNSNIIDNKICHIFRGITIGLIPLAINMPAAVSIYCLSSSLYGLLQAFILNSSPIRRLLKIPVRNDNRLKLKIYSQSIKEKKREA